MSVSDIALVTVTQALAHLRIDPNLQSINNEMVDRGDGVEIEFSLAHVPIAGTLIVYLDGVEQELDDDYTLENGTITFDEAPGDGVKITADYETVDGALSDADQLLLETMIEAATQKAEEYTGRCFVQRTLTELRVGDGKTALKLYKQPVVEVTSIEMDGEPLVPDTDYGERLSIGRLYRNQGWDLNSEIEITYEVGYESTREDTQPLVPQAVLAILTAVTTWWNNRMGVESESVSGVGSVSYGEVYELPPASKALLSALRVNPLC